MNRSSEITRRLRLLIVVLIVVHTAGITNAYGDGITSLRGLVDLVAQGDDDVRLLNTTNVRDSNFDPLRARLFVEGSRGNTQVFLQFLFSQESFDATRMFGAYVMQRLFDGRDHWLEAGKIPVHDGIWSPHTYSNKNPLIDIPLAYYWKANLPNRMMPTDLDQLLEQRGQGQAGVFYADSLGARGVPYASNPILSDNCWNYGLYSLGVAGRFEYAFGLTYGSAAAPVSSLDSNEDLALHAKLGFVFTPGLRAWVSATRGAYLARDVARFLPVGKSVNDYYQELVIVSADWRWRHVFVMGEVFFNHFDTPLRADGLSNRSLYVQGVYTVAAGWDIAVRYDEMRYEVVEGSAVNTSWDQDVYRFEGGVNYNISRDVRIKGVVQGTHIGNGWESRNIVPALQMTVSF